MSDVSIPRPRRWWLALILNLLLPPTGYAYVGAWNAVGVTMAAVLLGPLALDEWTLLRPPGVYALGGDALLWTGGAFAIGVALHAAWLARRAPATTGRSRVLVCLTPWIILMIANLGLRAYWPYPAYTISSAAMEPTLRPGDVLIVNGARALCGKTNVKPGDVVVYRRGMGSNLHRVVAAPGQTVAMQHGLLMIDGKVLPRRAMGSVPVAGLAVRATEIEETLPNGVSYRTYDLGSNGALDHFAPTTVPAGSWYVLGDSRENSRDSRVDGPVPAASVCAVALKIGFAKDKRRVGRKP